MEYRIVKAFEELAAATSDYARAAFVAACSKQELEAAKAEGLASGVIEGKNAELREAKAREVLVGFYANVEAAEQTEHNCRLRLDLARIEVDSIKTLLRYLEYSKV